MANGKLLDLLNAIRDLFEGLGSSTSTDDVPLVGEIKTPSFRSGRRTSRRRGKEYVKGKIGDMALEADGQDAPEMLQSTGNTLTNAYARRKGIDFVVGTLQKLRDKEHPRLPAQRIPGADASAPSEYVRGPVLLESQSPIP